MNFSLLKLTMIAPLVATATVFLNSGCGVLSTEPYKQTSVYDLGIPKSINKATVPVTVGRFGAEGPYKSKMILRSLGNNLHFNDYAKWAQSPELMLKRYLKLAFGTASSAGSRTRGEFVVSGTILVFEADEPSRTVSLVVDYAIKRSGSFKQLDSGRASFSTRLTTVTSDSISVAMSENAAEFADLIMKEINKMSAIK